MLLEFSVTNFRSIRTRQTLSMAAAPRLGKRGNVMEAGSEGEKLPGLLKAAAIYGANASGKSNLLQALVTVKDLALAPPTANEHRLKVAPFRFDPELRNDPSEFELHFIANGVRYEFGMAATSERIVGEYLTSYPGGRETPLYKRRHVGDRDEYELHPALEGGPEVHRAWQRLTSPKTLFIAQAVASSDEALTQLRHPFTWLQSAIMSSLSDMGVFADAAQGLARETPRFAEELAGFLREVDVPVTNLRFEELAQGQFGAGSGADQRSDAKSREARLLARYVHETALGTAEFSFHEESRGTQNLIGFWLPWGLLQNQVAENYRILVVDELDSSLHPNIVASIVEKHLATTFRTQLIFTTHDTHLMNTRLLRRDQIWVTERDRNGATVLRSIHDFAGREGEDVEKRYFEGRYRGLPITRRG